MKITLLDSDGQYASASNTNINNTTLETAFENTLSRDGTTPNQMTSSLDMNSNRILNLPSAASNSEPATYGQVLSIIAGTTSVVIGPSTSVVGHLPIWNNTSGSILADSGKTLPSGSLLGTTDTQTLTNKTLISPVISSPSGLVKADVGLSNVDNTSDATKNSATATLSGKTIDGGSNTLTSIPAGNLTGNISVSRLNSGTGATSTTFWRGDGTWGTPSGGGNVSGPGSATANAIALFNGTTGTVIKDSAVTLPLTPSNGGKPSNRFSNFTSSGARASTTSSTQVMVGLGSVDNWVITPSTTGRVRIRVTGTLGQSAIGSSTVCVLKYGTGTPPAPNAAGTGTAMNAFEFIFSSGGVSELVPFATESEVSGLTLATQYWFDMGLRSTSGGTGTFYLSSVVIEEF